MSFAPGSLGHAQPGPDTGLQPVGSMRTVRKVAGAYHSDITSQEPGVETVQNRLEKGQAGDDDAEVDMDRSYDGEVEVVEWVVFGTGCPA